MGIVSKRLVRRGGKLVNEAGKGKGEGVKEVGEEETRVSKSPMMWTLMEAMSVFPPTPHLPPPPSPGTENEDGTVSVTFGKLFDAYTRISDTLVGWLVRARKRGYVTFEGEMLYQGKDNDVIITRIKMPETD